MQKGAFDADGERIDEDDGEDLSSALAKLRLDYDDYQQELEQRRSHDPCNEAEDGWVVVKEDVDVWDFTEEVGRVLPD